MLGTWATAYVFEQHRADVARTPAQAYVFEQHRADIDVEFERLSQAGVEFVGGVSDFKWGRIASFKDTEGNDLQLYGPPKA